MQYARHRFLLLLFAAIAMGLLVRAVDLQVLRQAFLQNQGDVRQQRVVTTAAHRGMVLDRNGEALAVSTPVDAVWANPKKLLSDQDLWPQLAALLDLPLSAIQKKVFNNQQKGFIYLKRLVTPVLGQQVMALKVAGVGLQREYYRYYPAGEVTSHVVGFTNIDDQGQEGLELAFDRWLTGVPGRKLIVQDRLGRPVGDLKQLTVAQPGKNLTLSIDKRLQYLAYRELKATVQKYHAHSGSVVIMDVHTGEILAMVNQPSYNPNKRSERRSAALRNRAVTDVLEPGSTIKPLTVVAALESGQYRPDTLIQTSPGWFMVKRLTVQDSHDYGLLDLTGIIRKSSNVGVSKIALSLAPEQLWDVFSRLGLGRSSGSGFPGESAGLLSRSGKKGKVKRVTMSYGYGLSVTPLQLVRAYSAMAADGILPAVSFQKLTGAPEGERVLSSRAADMISEMLTSVVAKGGTGARARVVGYRVAGKTGTVRKSASGSYAKDRHVALFTGFAPVSNPRLAAVVVVNEPQGKKYYGGQVAAPLFSKVMSGALRLLNVLPDDLPEPPMEYASIGGGL
ncbi:MAG: penicillin-binding transpeptidase domain-containing protein [Gammaproteobacteria bacterium]|nr:penicillin-binding transpeptidase domain-containing protein [Gammaproteobacteria bacterium]